MTEINRNTIPDIADWLAEHLLVLTDEAKTREQINAERKVLFDKIVEGLSDWLSEVDTEAAFDAQQRKFGNWQEYNEDQG